MANSEFRRGARAVELATLERWYTGNGIVGSNPTLSATNAHKAVTDIVGSAEGKQGEKSPLST